jgi:hypothetical protein
MRAHLASLLPAAIAALSVTRASAAREVSFSGYTWTVRSSDGDEVGPGPNVFSDAADSVWVDATGRLHLRIVQRGGEWTCAEVIAQASLGYGTYRIVYDTRVDDLDPNAVLGLFTWSDATHQAHREIDIEFSRWGEKGAPNAQYVVQPATVSSHLHRFAIAGGGPTSHVFRWRPGSVSFESVVGPRRGAVLQRWRFDGSKVPVPGDENPRINLWLFRGAPPAAGRPIEVIVSRFDWSRSA